MVTGKVMVLIGKILVPLKPTNVVSDGRRHSLSILIYWNSG